MDFFWGAGLAGFALSRFGKNLLLEEDPVSPALVMSGDSYSV